MARHGANIGEVVAPRLCRRVPCIAGRLRRGKIGIATAGSATPVGVIEA